MKAIVVERAGGPEVLTVTDVPTPAAKPGWVLVRVRAFGLNRSEMFTRQGHSPNVAFPRVLGIECVGEVEEDGDAELARGQKVAAVMGQMGRDFDGGYAEYTCVPASQALPVETGLDWATFGALPETFLTAWGSLHRALTIRAGQSLLVRGATSSVGMAAITLAKDAGVEVVATTRNPDKVDGLKAQGADHVIVGGDAIGEQVRALYPDGVGDVLELVGTRTMKDSLDATARGGTVCITGIVGGEWVVPDFAPMEVIPSGVKLTKYSSQTIDRAGYAAAMQEIVTGVEQGRFKPAVDKVFRFEEIVEAHRYMEENRALGKLVVVTD